MINSWISYSVSMFDFFVQQVMYSSILFVCILPFHFALKRVSPYWTAYLWILVLARLIIPPSFALPFSARSVLAQLSDVFSNYSSKLSTYSTGEEHLLTIDLLTNQNIVSPIPQSEWIKIFLLLLWLAGVIVMTIH